MWTKPPFHNLNKSIESYQSVKMSAVAGDPINASICVSSLFHPGSWGDSGLLIVFLLTSGVWFHLPVLHSSLSSFSPVSPSSRLRPPHCPSVRSCLNSALLSTLLPPSACSCCPRRLFDKTFRSSNEQKPAARQQWSPCVHLIIASLLWPAWKAPRMLVRLVNGPSDMTLYIRTHHQNRAKHIRLS